MSRNLTIVFAVLAALAIISIVAIIVIVAKRKSEVEIVEEDEQKHSLSSADNIQQTSKERKKSIKEHLKKLDSSNAEGLTDYNKYEMSTIEKIKWAAIAMAVVFVGCYIFYNSVIWSLVGSLIGLLYPKIKKKSIIKERKRKLLLQFKEALYVISSSLSAGRSVENAFIDAYNDLKTIFDFGKENYILDELNYINRKIKLNGTIEEALYDFAKRSGLEDIKTFADVFDSCKSTGGNLKAVTERTSNTIGEKISIKQDIDTMISGKKYEAKLLIFIPFGIILFLKMSSPSFLEPLYSLNGRFISTIALLIILLSNLWSMKIMDIEV